MDESRARRTQSVARPVTVLLTTGALGALAIAISSIGAWLASEECLHRAATEMISCSPAPSQLQLVVVVMIAAVLAAASGLAIRSSR